MGKHSPKKFKASKRNTRTSTSWENVAHWYNGWVGKRGSHYHRKVALPTVMELLELRPKEKVLDIGAGTGVLAPHVVRAGGDYVGLEVSSSLIKLARRYHGKENQVRLVHGDARHLQRHFEQESFDAAVFLLSIQDMTPLDAVLNGASWALKPGGRVVVFMIHPCFRVPRQSGWGYDQARKLRYRRIDRYLSSLSVPMKAHQKGQGMTKSFHRPLEAYISALTGAGLRLETLRELPDQPITAKKGEMDNLDIPLFLALQACKV